MTLLVRSFAKSMPALAFGAAVAACLLPAVDLSGKACPCAAPLVCDTTSNRCVDRVTSSDAGADGGCPTGRGDCDGNPANGCETDFALDPSHCGYCGHVCPARANAFPACTRGECAIGCNGGFDDCDGNEDNGCERPVSNDPANCGACAHDCQGGACQLGFCDPVQLATNRRAHCLITTAQDLYFGTESGDVVRLANKIAGTPETIATQGGFGNACSIVADDKTLFWSAISFEPVNVHRCALPTCAGGDSIVTNRPSRGLGVNAERFVIRTTSGISVFKKSALPDAGPANYGAPNGQVVHLDETFAFFGAGNAGQTIIVGSRNLEDGGAVSVLTSAANPVFDFALGSSAVYVTRADGVHRCVRPACGETPELMTNKGGTPNLIATDGVHVYWTFDGNPSNGFTDGAILRCPIAGCPPQGPLVLAQKQPRPSAISVDDKSVYWSSLDEPPATTGRVMKVAK
jgi:hypothetical protein